MKKEVCVITGGGSGMGLAAAKYMPKEKIILVTGQNTGKIGTCRNNEYQEARIRSYAKTCDTSIVLKLQELASICRRTGRNSKM